MFSFVLSVLLLHCQTLLGEEIFSWPIKATLASILLKEIPQVAHVIRLFDDGLCLPIRKGAVC